MKTPKPPKLTAEDVELAVVRKFDPRRNLIVPRVSWGLDLAGEADLVILRPSGYAVEVEIKVSRSDVLADLKKSHHQRHRKPFRQLFFAIPEELNRAGVVEFIPEHAGILAVRHDGHGKPWVEEVRPARPNPMADIWQPGRRAALARNCVIKYWSLAHKLRKATAAR